LTSSGVSVIFPAYMRTVSFVRTVSGPSACCIRGLSRNGLTAKAKREREERKIVYFDIFLIMPLVVYSFISGWQGAWVNS
jgi:hypothetical protein